MFIKLIYGHLFINFSTLCTFEDISEKLKKISTSCTVHDLHENDYGWLCKRKLRGHNH